MSLTPHYTPFGPTIDLSVIVPLFMPRETEFMALQGRIMELCFDKAPPETELVLVSNGDGGAEWIDKHPQHAGRFTRKVRFSNNTGVAAAWNAGASLADGRNLLFVNEDCIPTRETILAIHKTLDERPDVGVVGIEGHDFVWAGEPPTERPNAGCFRGFKSWGDPKIHKDWNPVPVEGVETMVVTGHLFGVRKADLIAVGKFGEDTSPLFCEDYAICFEMRRQLSKKTLTIPGEAYHSVGISRSNGPRAIPYLNGSLMVEPQKLWANWVFHKKYFGQPGKVGG